MQTT
ncbi:hypothetical protein D047_0462A, partial [Vibrio parahaemolyticus VPTS-2010_2]|jgi:putative transposase